MKPPMANDAWKPEQYRLFQNERRQPFIDLRALVRVRTGMRVVDLGCGTGELTRELHDHLKASTTVGIDASESMLAQSGTFTTSGLSFRGADIATFAPGGPLDLVFSNAALHWVPGHAQLLERFMGWLGEKGQLAIQLPAMEDDALHTVASQVAREEPFRTALNGFVQHLEIHAPQWYAERLYALGFREQNVSLRIYPHVLPTRESAIEWIKGSLLTAYQKRLTPEVYAAYLARYRDVLLPIMGDKDPYFLPYRRTLMWAQR
jgi:trans-aconitate 2-methyltransferase